METDSREAVEAYACVLERLNFLFTTFSGGRVVCRREPTDDAGIAWGRVEGLRRVAEGKRTGSQECELHRVRAERRG